MAQSAEEAPAASGRVRRRTTLTASAGAGGEGPGEDVRQVCQCTLCRQHAAIDVPGSRPRTLALLSKA